MIEYNASMDEVRETAKSHLEKLSPKANWDNIKDPFFMVQCLREVVVVSQNPENLWLFHMEGKTKEAEEIYKLCEDAVDDLTVIDEIYKVELNKLLHTEFENELEGSNWE